MDNKTRFENEATGRLKMTYFFRLQPTYSLLKVSLSSVALQVQKKGKLNHNNS